LIFLLKFSLIFPPSSFFIFVFIPFLLIFFILSPRKISPSICAHPPPRDCIFRYVLPCFVKSSNIFQINSQAMKTSNQAL
jgi:hypothetical protein